MALIRLLRTAGANFAGEGGVFLAQAIAFNVLFTAIPLVLLLVAMLGFVYGTDEGNVEALSLIQTYAPEMLGLVSANLESVVRYRGASGVLGLVGLAWSGKNIFQALGYALDRSLGVTNHRHIVHDIAFALVLIPVAGIALVAASALPVVISIIVRFTGLASFRYVPEVATYAAAFVVVLTISAALYTYLPNRRPASPLFGLPGAIVFAVGWSLAQVAFAVYTTHTVFLRIYGAVSTAFALLLWIYLTAVIFLYGAYVCSAWEQRVRKPVNRVEPA